MTKKTTANAIPGVRHSFRVREFASLAGVTVKALQHYDRLGLLRPARTAAGHRAYSTRDRERLRQILALKRVGVPLTRMRGLLDAEAATLTTFVRTRREELAREQARLDSVDRALALVEENLTHAPATRAGLSVLADVTDVPLDAAAMATYFSGDAWEVARRVYEDWPDPRWIPLYRDIGSAIREGSDNARNEQLLHRWNTLGQSLWRGMTSEPELSRQLHDGFRRAWKDRECWPETLKRRFADYRIDDIAVFLGRALTASRNPAGRTAV